VDGECRMVELGKTKREFLERTGVVALRCHDAWDRWPGIGICGSWAGGLGFTELVSENSALGVGCGGPDRDMIDLGADALIVCCDGDSYWMDRERLVEPGAGVIMVEHGTSEMWGRENLAKYLREAFPELDVRYFARHPRAWHPRAWHIP